MEVKARSQIAGASTIVALSAGGIQNPCWNQSSRCAIGNMEVALEKTNVSKSLVIAIAMVLLAATIGFFLIGGTRVRPSSNR